MCAILSSEGSLYYKYRFVSASDKAGTIDQDPFGGEALHCGAAFIWLRELREGAGKHGLGMNLCASFQPQTRRSYFSAPRRSMRALVMVGPSTALATKARAKPRRILGRSASSSWRLRNEGLEADHIENGG